MGIIGSRPIAKLLATLAVFVCTFSHAAIPPSERAVLDAIYAQTGGSNWTNKTGWVPGTPGTECSWFGIQCDGQGAHVIGVALTSGTGDSCIGNHLSGSLPSISGLTALQSFNVSCSVFSGGIPSLTGLTNLVEFDVSNTRLSGSLPSLAGLVNLKTFYAYNNNLSGTIPALTGLVNLEDLQIDGNHLTGTLPALTGLSKLRLAFFDGNQLTGTVPSLTGLSNLSTLLAHNNQLTGGFPSLAGLTNLQIFTLFGNQLTGPIPPLTGLTNLQLFGVQNNQLTGTVPALDGLSKLSFFSVANNRLTGSIPSLASLPALQYLQVGGNGLSGNVPTAPATLLSVPFAQSPSLGQSTLCNNALNPTADSGWDAATAVKPWYSTCTLSPSVLTFTTAETTVATGTSTTITATITTSASAMSAAKALIADVAGASMGTVTVTDDQGKLICYIVIVNNTGSCTVVLPTGTTNITGGYSGTLSIAPASASFSKTNNAPSSSLDQHGWTGAWYNQPTSRQGFVIEVYPDLNAPGNGLFGGSWFTFDTSVGGEDHQRWYTLSGDAPSTGTSTTLDIYANEGGNFSAPPVINTANGKAVVGHAAISFSSCGSANFYYSFTDGSGRVDTIPLTRLDQNVTCDEKNGAGNGATAGSFLLSGAWYDPATSGQGLLFDVNPPLNVTFAAWYTFAPGGQAIGGGTSQRWYTLQATPTAAASVGTAPLAMTIYSSVGGVFNTANSVHPASTSPVGTASITFSSCTALTLSYTFNAGTNNGLSGNINLRRVGPVPAGCNL